MKTRHLMASAVALAAMNTVVSIAGDKQQVQSTVQTLQPQTQVLQPKMRPVDRDWNYFKSIACDQIGQVVFHSRSEEILLAKRKAQCVNKYKAFLPKPVKP